MDNLSSLFSCESEPLSSALDADATDYQVLISQPPSLPSLACSSLALRL